MIMKIDLEFTASEIVGILQELDKEELAKVFNVWASQMDNRNDIPEMLVKASLEHKNYYLNEFLKHIQIEANKKFTDNE